MYTSYDLSLISGDEFGCFNPTDNTIRAEAATVFTKYVAMLEDLEEQGLLHEPETEEEPPQEETPGEETPGEETPGEETPGEETPPESQAPSEEEPPAEGEESAPALSQSRMAPLPRTRLPMRNSLRAGRLKSRRETTALLQSRPPREIPLALTGSCRKAAPFCWGQNAHPKEFLSGGNGENGRKAWEKAHFLLTNGA